MSIKMNKTGATQAELFTHTLGEKQVTEAKQKAETARGLDCICQAKNHQRISY